MPFRNDHCTAFFLRMFDGSLNVLLIAIQLLPEVFYSYLDK